jgi:hypothetical protein
MQTGRRVFLSLWLFIVLVSVIDGYLVVEHRPLITSTEMNPVGQALLKLNGGQIWYLIAAKFTGTVAVGAVLLVIEQHWKRVALAITSTIAALQMALLLFLMFA